MPAMDAAPGRPGMRIALACALALALSGCAPARGRIVPYQGEIQNTRTHGGEALRIVTARNPAVAQYVAAHSQPDFVLVTSAQDVELVYYDESRLVHFHRVAGETRIGELSPLPLEVANVLPVDLPAGTPGSIDPEVPWQAGCWHVDAEDTRCRTCCRSPIACASTCEPRP